MFNRYLSNLHVLKAANDSVLATKNELTAMKTEHLSEKEVEELKKFSKTCLTKEKLGI